MARGRWVAGSLVIATPFIVAFAVLAAMLVLLTGEGSAAACARGAATPAPDRLPSGTVAGYSGEQLINAALIMDAAATLGLDRQAQVIGVMTAMGESTLRNIEYGDDLQGVTNPDGTPTCSVGLFQQQWCLEGGGSREEALDPTLAATRFFTGLADITDWRDSEPSLVAHRVQRNADPFHYEKFVGPAREVVAALADDDGGCAGDGRIVVPLSPGYSLTSDYGPRAVTIPGASSWHPAVDLQHWPDPCGDRIYSIGAGTVTYVGGIQVTIKSPDGWSASYLHMKPSEIFVAPGDRVVAGQEIALVGDEGPSGGCHLDLRISKDGSIDPAVSALPAGEDLDGPASARGFVDPEEFYRAFGIELCPVDECRRS